MLLALLEQRSRTDDREKHRDLAIAQSYFLISCDSRKSFNSSHAGKYTSNHAVQLAIRKSCPCRKPSSRAAQGAIAAAKHGIACVPPARVFNIAA